MDRNNNGVRDDGEMAGVTRSRGQFLVIALPTGRMPIFAEPITQFGFPIEKITDPARGFYLMQLSDHKRIVNLAFGMSRYEA